MCVSCTFCRETLHSCLSHSELGPILALMQAKSSIPLWLNLILACPSFTLVTVSHKKVLGEQIQLGRASLTFKRKGPGPIVLKASSALSPYMVNRHCMQRSQSIFFSIHSTTADVGNGSANGSVWSMNVRETPFSGMSFVLLSLWPSLSYNTATPVLSRRGTW